MTIMRDSKVGDEWIRETMRKNPPRRLANGGIFTGIVRLAFPSLFKVRQARPGQTLQGEPKFETQLLFPVGTDMSVFEQAYLETARPAFPNNWGPNGEAKNLFVPFRSQDEKAYGDKPYQGYTPGGVFLKVTTRNKPAVVDSRMNLVTDESRVYAGVWAFVTVNPYVFGLNPPQPVKGVSFGLQSVMIAQDDERFGGGGGGNPQADFAGVQITAGANVAAKFEGAPGAAQPAQPAPAASLMPSGGHVGTAGGLQTQPLPEHDPFA